MGAHCWECLRAARPPIRERARRWNATTGPLATKALIGLNLAVFVLTATDGGAMGRDVGGIQARLALFGPAVADGQLYRLITAGFVHYGLIHLGFNMLVLWRLGSELEPALGRVRYIALYVTALLAGSFGALLLSPDALTAGASGAVFGLFGAAAAGQYRRGIDIWSSGIGGLIVLNLIITFAVPGISIGGHLGGLVAGLCAGWVMLDAPPTRRSAVQGLLVCGALAAASIVGAVVATGP